MSDDEEGSSPKICRLRPEVDWSGDEDRVHTLMSPFRSKDLNPHAWDAKMLFWQATLDKWLVQPDLPDPRFSAGQAEKELCSGLSRRPHCLPQVIQHLEKCGQVVRADRLAHSWELANTSTWAQWSWLVASKGITGLVKGRLYFLDKLHLLC